MATYRRLRIQLDHPVREPAGPPEEPAPEISSNTTARQRQPIRFIPDATLSPPVSASPDATSNLSTQAEPDSGSRASTSFRNDCLSKESDSKDTLNTSSQSLSSRLAEVSFEENFDPIPESLKNSAVERIPGQFFGHEIVPITGATVTLRGDHFHLGSTNEPQLASAAVVQMRKEWLVKARELDRKANARRKKLGLGRSMVSAEAEREPEHFIPKQKWENEAETFADIGGKTTGEYIDDYLEQPVFTDYLGHLDAAPKIPVFGSTLAGLPNPLPRNAARLGITELLPIQRAVIPILHEGYDVIGVSPTGTGKTASFLVPIIWRILLEYRSAPSAVVLRPRALILCPTRELAEQIRKMALQLCFGTNISCFAVYGAIDAEFMRRKLHEGIDIIVGTPGRILEALQSKKISLAHVRHVVVDEVDRMLLARAFPAVVAILDSPAFPAPNRRQTMFFSATISDYQMHVLRPHQANPFSVRIGHPGPLVTIAQSFEKVKGLYEKENSLHRILDEVGDNAKVIVFVRTKDNANMLAVSLSGRHAATIHGGFTQKDRVEEMDKFLNGESNILITTDLASRGLDIAGIDLVINFNLPNTVQDYIHRIGRSGRKGHPGRAISFYDPTRKNDTYLIGPLITAMKSNGLPVEKWLEEEVYKGENGFALVADVSDAQDLADMGIFLSALN